MLTTIAWREAAEALFPVAGQGLGFRSLGESLQSAAPWRVPAEDNRPQGRLWPASQHLEQAALAAGALREQMMGWGGVPWPRQNRIYECQSGQAEPNTY